MMNQKNQKNQKNAAEMMKEHPLFVNTKMQEIVAQRTAMAIAKMDEMRVQQPEASTAKLLTDVLADVLSRGRKEITEAELAKEIEKVRKLTMDTNIRVEQARETGRKALEEKYAEQGEAELAQLLIAQHQLYQMNVEKASRANAQSRGAAPMENMNKVLNAISKKTREQEKKLVKAQVSGGEMNIDHADMAKMAAEYTTVNQMYMMLYKMMNASVITAKGNEVSLSEADPQAMILIPKANEHFAHQAIMNAVLMNIRQTGLVNVFVPDQKTISDEDLCFWYACKERLIGGCSRFAAGDAGVGEEILCWLGILAAVVAMAIGVALAMNIMEGGAVVEAICVGLTKLGFAQDLLLKSGVEVIIKSLGLKDNVLGLLMAFLGSSTFSYFVDRENAKFPLRFKETAQAEKIRDYFTVRKVVDVNENLERMYAQADKTMETVETIAMKSEEKFRAKASEQQEKKEEKHEETQREQTKRYALE